MHNPQFKTHNSKPRTDNRKQIAENRKQRTENREQKNPKNYKSQITNDKQIPIPNDPKEEQALLLFFIFGVGSLFVIWDL